MLFRRFKRLIPNLFGDILGSIIHSLSYIWEDKTIRFSLVSLVFVFSVLTVFFLSSPGIAHAASLDPTCPTGSNLSSDHTTCSSNPTCPDNKWQRGGRLCAPDGANPTCPSGTLSHNNTSCSDSTPACSQGNFQVIKIPSGRTTNNKGVCVGDPPQCSIEYMRLADANNLCVKDGQCTIVTTLGTEPATKGICVVLNPDGSPFHPKSATDCERTATTYSQHIPSRNGPSYCYIAPTCPEGSKLSTSWGGQSSNTARCESTPVCPGADFLVGVCLVAAQANTGGPAAAEPPCSTGTGLDAASDWIICPASSSIVKASKDIEDNFIVPFLTVSPLSTDINGQDPPVYKLWKNFRDLANIMLVIAFFVVIFSQATSFGIGNYGIKKMLPRLVLVAIGANLSFFIVAFIIDVFNVLGGGVASLVMSVVNNASGGGTSTGTKIEFWGLITAGLIVHIVKAGGILKAIIGILGIVFLLLLVVMIALILRQLAIILLVIISAPAIVLYLLPNTEQFYVKWQKLLIKLLLSYPLIVLAMAAGKLASIALSNTIVGGG